MSSDRDHLTEPLVDHRSDGGKKILFSDGNINRVVYNNEACRLELSTDHLICTEESSKRVTCCVKLSDIIGCQESVDTKDTAHSFPHRRLVVFCYPRQRTSSCCGTSFRRQRLQLTFTAINKHACTNLVNVIRTLAWALPLSLPDGDGDGEEGGGYREVTSISWLKML